MNVNYEFVTETETAIEKHKKDVLSFAGKLLQLTQTPTLIITLSNDDTPTILECNHGRITDYIETYEENILNH